MAISTAKGISILFDEVCELWDANNLFARMAETVNFSSPLQQNSANTIWRQVEQNSPVKEGWDMTGSFGNIIQRSYPSTLGNPFNDAFELRADDFRDDRFIKTRAKSAVNTLSADQNARIAQLVTDTGQISYVSTDAGYDHLAAAEQIMDENELSNMGERTFFLKPVNHRAIASDLAGRGTLSGRPEGAYGKSMVGSDIAGFDVYRANVIPTLAGTAAGGTAISGDQSFVPQGNVINTDGTPVPVDYREAVITVDTTTGRKRGDRFTVAGMKDLSLANHIESTRDKTFTVVEVVDATHLRIFPKPIAWDERPVSDGGTGAMTAEQAAYSNVSTGFKDADAIVFLNNSAVNAIWQPDVFWTNDSVEIVSGDAPFEEMGNMDGFRVQKETLDSGATVYIMWQGDIGTATLKCRVFVWYGLVNRKPSHNGIALPNFA